jgi:hypothetical protein
MAQSNDTIPYGCCRCGCGERTRIATRTRTELGWRRGEPIPYVHGHHGTKGPFYEVDPETGCWNWQRGMFDHGYGKIERGGKQIGAHCFMWTKLRGPIPEGLDLHHTCENPRCVNPDHLEPLTRREHIHLGPVTKLTFEQVTEIRRLAPTMTQRQVARLFGISQQHVSDIVTGKYRLHD